MRRGFGVSLHGLGFKTLVEVIPNEMLQATRQAYIVQTLVGSWLEVGDQEIQPALDRMSSELAT